MPRCCRVDTPPSQTSTINFAIDSALACERSPNGRGGVAVVAGSGVIEPPTKRLG
jgi:hypothetical protein